MHLNTVLVLSNFYFNKWNIMNTKGVKLFGPFIRAALLLLEYDFLVTRECSVITKREINRNRRPWNMFAIDF